ncbi:MAG TPA: integrase core domain-containing protein [Pseudaminobacter sp.]|nr:integrase core domain-containing protein [Pseudaminobacter sp.]
MATYLGTKTLLAPSVSQEIVLSASALMDCRRLSAPCKGWRQPYNTVRAHSSLDYRPPAPDAILWPAAQPGPASPATPAEAQTLSMH